MALADCLPASLRSATFQKMSSGLSGAGVYRVDHEGAAYVLKVAAADAPLEPWRRRLAVQRAAADAGVAPCVVHADDARRAVVSELIVDRSFPSVLMNPATRAAGLAQLGRTLRAVHALPVQLGEVSDPRAFMAQGWRALAGHPLPAFVGEAVSRIQDEPPPAQDRPSVLSHNDVNPSNLAYDGAQLFLLDWDVTGANDPLYDLASIALFLRFDDASCAALIAAHDDAAPTAIPPRFGWNRRLVATLAGVTLLALVRGRGHAGGAQSLADTVPLGEFYGRMMTGQVSLASVDGQWMFALALIHTALTT